ncbi:hypothetical protein CKO25_13860 [Thiocapsa imhoffii]|uniref:Outer membrane protein beta-barrel domain-containing protein n=1 Tax=Thiocapsa imhoffii TaxID=382777 RepID=A0A9X0WJN6_9GAMM|nr:outer membrane beta-barrel protein [Thiocapsa imhoffii]MBK1645715.1 hypothetical protein [Thiocapsa imhoffii]
MCRHQRPRVHHEARHCRRTPAAVRGTTGAERHLGRAARRVLPLTLLALFVLPSAHADRWFIGAELTGSEVTFEPTVRFTSGRAPNRFEDVADGLGLSILGGRKIDLTPQWSVSAQGRFSYLDAQWTTTTPRSYIKYDMPYNFALSLLPEYRLSQAFSVFGELGGTVGEFNYLKRTSAPQSVTAYNESTTALGYVLGLGMRYALTPQLDIHATYRYAGYPSYQFVGRLGNGEVRELFEIDQSTQDIGVGMRWSW